MKNGALGLDWVLSFLGYRGWVEHTAEELIWGYEEPLFDLAKMAFPNAPNLTKFGFFAKKNATEVRFCLNCCAHYKIINLIIFQDLSTYTMYTGEVNPYNLSKISMYNGQSSLNKWSQPECNEVQGSDGATFNPYIQKVTPRRKKYFFMIINKFFFSRRTRSGFSMKNSVVHYL